MLYELYDYGDNLPEWSVAYIVNGDAEGLTEEEREMADSWAASYPSRSIIDVKAIHPEFTHRPAFGLACTCVSFEVHAPQGADHGTIGPRVDTVPVIY